MERPQPPAQTASALAAPSASSLPVAASPAQGEGAARIPFDFPSQTTTAKSKEYVLAPPRRWLDAALEKGKDKQPFIYYGAWMQTPGPTASEVRTVTGKTELMPNALIVGVSSGQRASPRDVVLTTWASGTGMQRAIVVSGGSDQSPMVRYLDMAFESPDSFAKKEEQLPPDTFVKLTRAGDVGTTAACREGGGHMRYVVTAATPTKILGLGFAGKVRAFARSDCRFLPITTRLEEGDAIFAPVVGRYVEARVRRVDKRLGRVWARHRADDQETETAFAVLDVAKTLQ